MEGKGETDMMTEMEGILVEQRSGACTEESLGL